MQRLALSALVALSLVAGPDPAMADGKEPFLRLGAKIL